MGRINVCADRGLHGSNRCINDVFLLGGELDFFHAGGKRSRLRHGQPHPHRFRRPPGDACPPGAPGRADPTRRRVGPLVLVGAVRDGGIGPGRLFYVSSVCPGRHPHRDPADGLCAGDRRPDRLGFPGRKADLIPDRRDRAGHHRDGPGRPGKTQRREIRNTTCAATSLGSYAGWGARSGRLPAWCWQKKVSWATFRPSRGWSSAC